MSASRALQSVLMPLVWNDASEATAPKPSEVLSKIPAMPLSDSACMSASRALQSVLMPAPASAAQLRTWVKPDSAETPNALKLAVPAASTSANDDDTSEPKLCHGFLARAALVSAEVPARWNELSILDIAPSTSDAESLLMRPRVAITSMIVVIGDSIVLTELTIHPTTAITVWPCWSQKSESLVSLAATWSPIHCMASTKSGPTTATNSPTDWPMLSITRLTTSFTCSQIRVTAARKLSLVFHK